MDYALRLTQLSFAVAIFLVLSLTGGEAQARRGELRPVRATLGCVEVRNWENNLVKVNPNLRHYHWNPIYANIQGTRLVGPPPPPKQRLTSRPKKHEVASKPKRDQVKGQPANYIFRPAKERPSVYKRPMRVAPRRNPSTSTSIAYKHVAPTLNSTNTSLGYKHVAPQLSSRDTMARVSTNNPPPMTATQAELQRKALMAKLNPRQEALNAQAKKLQLASKDVNGRLSTKECNGQLMTSKCEGQLMTSKCEGELVAKTCNATFADTPAVYAPYTRGEAQATSRTQTKTRVNAQIRKF